MLWGPPQHPSLRGILQLLSIRCSRLSEIESHKRLIKDFYMSSPEGFLIVKDLIA